MDKWENLNKSKKHSFVWFVLYIANTSPPTVSFEQCSCYQTFLKILTHEARAACLIILSGGASESLERREVFLKVSNRKYFFNVKSTITRRPTPPHH